MITHVSYDFSYSCCSNSVCKRQGIKAVPGCQISVKKQLFYFFTGAEVQQKWLNLRTCFSRELKAQETKSGQAAKKRRKYRYFERLLFLKSSLAQRPTDGNVGSTAVEGEDETQTSDTLDSNSSTVRQTQRNKKANQNSKFEESLLNVLKDDLNEDKHFALSLVPTLQSMTDDEKFQAKIEILQVCRRIKANRQCSHPSITPLSNNFLQPSSSYPGHFRTPNNFPQTASTNFLQSTNYHAAGDYIEPLQINNPSSTPPIEYSRTEHIRQCPSSSPQNSLESLQSYVSNFTPSPQSEILDLNLN